MSYICTKSMFLFIYLPFSLTIYKLCYSPPLLLRIFRPSPTWCHVIAQQYMFVRLNVLYTRVRVSMYECSCVCLRICSLNVWVQLSVSTCGIKEILACVLIGVSKPHFNKCFKIFGNFDRYYSIVYSPLNCRHR